MVLRPGACPSVPLVVAIRRKVVTVPASPVVVGPNGDYVCVVGDGNKVTRVDVRQAARAHLRHSDRQCRLDNGTVVAVEQTKSASRAELN